MKLFSVKEFIKTGKLGSIGVGSTKHEIIEQFGKRYDFGDCGETCIIKYGWYEFFYWTETEKVFGIQNDHLQADCVNHADMIFFRNKNFIIDHWFLKVGENITFKEIIELLNAESITYTVEPAYKGSDALVIKCSESQVTFDFADEYSHVVLTKKGKFAGYKDIVETNQSGYVLNGIRLFDY